MTWCPGLNIYRVNRFHLLENTPAKKKTSSWESTIGKFDIIEELLCHNLLHVVECIFDYVGYPYTWSSCIRVNKLWNGFLITHIFPRWDDRVLREDESLVDLYPETTFMAAGRICWQVHKLRQVWEAKRPKLKRLSCDSFVLSVRLCHDGQLYCGLNNGCLQLWRGNGAAKVKEQEMHGKGVKSLDIGEDTIVTGSYDCTAKVWTKDTWTLKFTITVHNDSVWDLCLRGNTLVTGGLDGVVAIFSLQNNALETKFLFQASQDLVAAVDFNDDLLVTGFEDAQIAMWNIVDARLRRRLNGHTGGITGIKLNGNLFASASYDGTVRLWTTEGLNLAVFDEPTSLLRCIGFCGSTVAAGDFGGNIHLWNLDIRRSREVRIRSYHHTQSHKSHVVCLQINAQRMVTGSRDKTVLVHDYWENASKR